MPAYFGSGIFAEQRAFASLEIRQHDATEVCFAYVADVRDHFIHGLEEVLCAAELDAGL